MRRYLTGPVVAVLVGALVLAGCGGSTHSSPKPKIPLARLKTILLAASELPLTGFTARIDPGIDQPLAKTAIANYHRAGDSSVLSVSINETASVSAAQQALQVLRKSDDTLIDTTTGRLPFGTDGQVLAGTDKITKDPDVQITFVQGASIISVSLLGTAEPAIPQVTLVEVARRQNYKYIADAK